MKTEMLGMILAGGRGSRLFELTTKSAKPAVYYGGKYRIIDFPLSNCANSNVSIVGILTQYESVLLNSYVSQSATWGLESRNAGTFVLSPREKSQGFNLYAGTADAIYQNIDFMDQYDPDYILILSGDHIYKMDYDKMLDFHKEKGADLTIAGLTVTLEEAKRFGIMNTEPDGKIYEFEEKPAHPKSTAASMGIYIFSYKKLREALILDHEKQDSEHDFGKNIIPYFLANGYSIYAYPFEGYWKDVGTIDSLWQANMDLLDPADPLKMYDQSWPIYTEDVLDIPQFIAATAKVKNSLINQGSVVAGNVTNSVIFRNVIIEEGAEIKDSVIMPGAVIGKNAKINHCIVAEDVQIRDGSQFGSDDKIKLVHKESVGE